MNVSVHSGVRKLNQKGRKKSKKQVSRRIHTWTGEDSVLGVAEERVQFCEPNFTP